MADEVTTTLYQPTPEEKAQALANLKQLDPNKQGLNARALRAFYPNQSWNFIRGLLEALKEDGSVKHKFARSPGGKTNIEVYTWE